MRHTTPALAWILVFVTGTAVVAEQLEVIDLASSSAWTAAPDGSSPRTINVPGGGYNAQGMSCSDHMLYQRSITIPAGAAGKVVKLLFGAVNYGADVLINNTLVGSHRNLFIPFGIDLTGHVTAGNTYTLQVKAYTRNHYQDRIPRGTPGWCRVPFGITRHVKLVVHPQVYIDSYWIIPSVEHDRLTFDVTVHNASSQSKSLSIGATLSSWNNHTWSYPSVAPKSVTVAPGAQQKVRLSAPWGLGPDSYWWPNLPFREDYQAKLHFLNVSISEGAAVLDTIRPRFGFVQWGEGPYYYTVNGVRFTSVSDGTAEGQFGYDAYTEYAAFKPPTGPGTGCEESFKRYMRLGVNANRTHASIPTEYMMDVADEIGFMLYPESAIRGFGECGTFDSASYCDDVRETAITCRNHPSICRYSVENEYNCGDPAEQERLMIDAGWYGDSTRPLVIEGGYGGAVEMKIGKHTPGHAFNMQHYSNPRSVPPRMSICGLGEYAWNIGGPANEPTYCGDGGLMRLADIGLDMRKRDWTHFSVWNIMSFWPNLLPGVSLSNYHCCSGEASRWTTATDRTDGVNGWGSHEILFLQRCLDPFLACDSAIDAGNVCYSNPWPSTVPSLTSGSSATRRVYLFNGGVRGNQLKFVWELRWNSATGSLAATGQVDQAVEPGFYRTVPVTFTVPSSSATASPITVTGGSLMFEDTRNYFSVGSSRLYFVLKSYLMEPASRFAVRPTTLVLTGSAGVSDNVAVTSAGASLGQISAQSSQPWLSASVSGSGASQTITTTASASGMAPGVYSGNVILTASGFEPVSYNVELRVPGGSVVSILPPRAVVLPNGSATFEASLNDALGVAQAAAFNWSISGGGNINSNGAFTSNGTVGNYDLTASVQADASKSYRARVMVTDGKPLTANVLTELLVLTTPSNSTSLPTGGPFVAAMDEKIGSDGTLGPCSGQQVSIDGTVYTWQTRASTSGRFFSQLYSSGYASVLLLSPTQQTARVHADHYFTCDVFRNGEKVATWGSCSPYNDFHSSNFTLQQGANVMVFKQITSNQGFLRVKFTDLSNAALSNVRYVIDTCDASVPVSAPAASTIPPPLLCAVRILGNTVEFAVNGTGRHQVDIISARGQVVRSLRGEGSKAYRIRSNTLTSGLYVIQARDTRGRMVRKLLSW